MMLQTIGHEDIWIFESLNNRGDINAVGGEIPMVKMEHKIHNWGFVLHVGDSES